VPPDDHQVALGCVKVVLGRSVDVATAQCALHTELGRARPDEVAQAPVAGVARRCALAGRASSAALVRGLGHTGDPAASHFKWRIAVGRAIVNRNLF
jgi:hypothetical protein